MLFEYGQHTEPVSIHSASAIGLDYKSDGLYMDSRGHIGSSHKYYRESQQKLAAPPVPEAGRPLHGRAGTARTQTLVDIAGKLPGLCRDVTITAVVESRSSVTCIRVVHIQQAYDEKRDFITTLSVYPSGNSREGGTELQFSYVPSAGGKARFKPSLSLSV